MDIVKEIMIVKKSAEYTLRGKSGWGEQPAGEDVGWFVGYLETNGNTYYFANCMQTTDFSKANARRDIVFRILDDMNLLREK